MLLRLSRTAQANANGHCRACLASPSWRPIVTPLTTSQQPLRGHERSYGGRTVSERDFVDVIETNDRTDETTDEIMSHARKGTTVTRTAAGDLRAGGSSRAWLDRRLNRVTSSVPCVTEPGQEPEGQWSMDDDNEGVARAIEAICVPQALLKNSERTLQHREMHLDSLHAVYFRTKRLVSSAVELGQVIEAQHNEEENHVKSVRENGKLSSDSDIRPEKAEDFVYDPKGLPIHETDIQQLDADNIQEELLHHGPYRGPRKDMHVNQNRQRINALVDALMKQAVTERFRGKLDPIRRAIESLDGPWTALEMLRQEGYPKYQSTRIDPIAAAEGIKKINDHARMVFARWEQAIIEEKAHGRASRKKDEDSGLTTAMLYKICFNLLTQVYEPEVHTFNTLILGFTMVGEHRLARIVMDSFLRSKMMPTKATVVIILHHYYASNDILGFYHWVRRMIGLDSMGVGIRRVRLSTTEDDGETFLSWAERENVALRGEWLVTRSWLDASEMEALLKGLIYFGQAQHAAQILSMSLKRGHAIQTTTFIDLLALIGSRLDHDAASLLVRGLCANAGDLISLLLEDDDSVCPALLVTQLRRVLELYAVRLSMVMGTDKHNWAKSPVDFEEGVALQHRRDVYVNTARLLTTERPRHPNDVYQFLPGLSTIVMALRIKEISQYLNQVDGDLEEIRSRINRAKQRIDETRKKPGSSLAPKIQAWWRQRFPPTLEAPPMGMAFHKHQQMQKIGERWRAMSRLHILAEQVDLVIENVAGCIQTFSQMPFVPSELKDAMYLSMPSVSVDSCVKLAHKHHNAEWVAAAQEHRKINAPFYKAALRRGRWSRQDVKRLQVEAKIAIQASLRLSYKVKATMARSLPPNADNLLLDAYGTWRRVPIEKLAQYYMGDFNEPPPRAEDKETRLVMPVANYWNRRTYPFHYLPGT
ncbi:hypothetical protein PgNI_05769 [Pyricularia grisea]|uniref:Pentatricopeptide repeat domain-containing protein n=1 Tax=Pyricularia grisea TaxID=148305 RepID=A0A6P8B6V9_PYRGI|nr:hypothetical protein PgNI_05769 [Pyricularia grisea]TLD11051.1 hypothetical protein PgNI_05769 [Pyricularia grisea]